jgi:hypothetical protein
MIGHKVGIQPETIEALRARAALDKFTGREQLLVEFTRTLMHEHELSADLFARMERQFGQAKFIEAVGLLGHYITIGTVIRMFDVNRPRAARRFSALCSSHENPASISSCRRRPVSSLFCWRNHHRPSRQPQSVLKHHRRTAQQTVTAA